MNMDEARFRMALESMKQNRTQGASELARECLLILKQSALYAEADSVPALCQCLKERADRLCASRPSMATVHNLVSEWLESVLTCGAASLEILRQSAADLADSQIIHSNNAVKMAAAHAARLIGEGKCIITHSISSTVCEVFQQLRIARVNAIVTESRPLNEGHMLAGLLSNWAIPVELITEAQAGIFMPQADCMLIGADSVLADGAVVNKSGTYLMALAARQSGVPVYVCYESFKRRPEISADVTLEQMAPEELEAPVLAGVKVRNIYFDITPAMLINAWIDETGVCRDFLPGKA
jgi:translation initiation factor 2B subunit (eIF-2B alpha/beta/delta family)